MGVGEASGMFPIGRGSCAYDKEMVHKFDALAAEMGYSWTLEQILPQPVPAGTPAGILTPEGAALLDPSGDLQPGIPLAPCEGDAGTRYDSYQCCPVGNRQRIRRNFRFRNAGYGL